MPDELWSGPFLKLSILFLFTGGVSAWKLYRRAAESQRLFELRKKWGYVARDESATLQRLRRNLVIGYSVFLVVSCVMLVWNLYMLIKTLP
jgi:hypothetical protein